MNTIKVSKTFPATAEQLYTAWLDGRKHSKMTGAKATSAARVNRPFICWDGYIRGTTVALVPNEKIVQRWRTTDFKTEEEDSMLEIRFREMKTGTQVTIIHSKLPVDQADGYRNGWKEYYFAPMMKYFSAG
jgi:activator of HSP90 ATPase